MPDMPTRGSRLPQTRTADVVIVGAGPAGLATANTAAAHGLRVLLLDENTRVGGQIGRLPFTGPAAPVEALHPNVEFLPRRVCLGWDRDRDRDAFIVHGPEGLERIEGRAHVAAVGAFERVYPVSGWTKPGVMTAGAAQALLKGSGSLPYNRVLVAGTGPLLLATAAQLITAGVTVVAVVEAARPGWRDMRHVPNFLRGGGILRQGLHYMTTITRSRTPIRRGWAVREVVGNDRVEGALLERVDDQGKPISGFATSVECDAVLLSQGFSPATDLVAQAGADLSWDARREAWEPSRTDSFETSVPGLFAIGDSAGVAGSQVATLEGELLGHLLGERLAGHPRNARVFGLRRRLTRIGRFRAAMDAIFRVRPGTLSLAEDSEIACRCQETTVGEIRAAASEGVCVPSAVKLWTRAGMGVCQGRTCHHIVAALTAVTSDAVGQPPSARFPIRPLSLAALAAGFASSSEATPERNTQI